MFPDGQRDALPGVPFPPGPKELISFHAPEPTGGSSPLGPQPATMGSGDTARGGLVPIKFCPLIATLASAEISPGPGARNELPQVPRIVKSLIGDQLKATFGLLVPLTSLYWS